MSEDGAQADGVIPAQGDANPAGLDDFADFVWQLQKKNLNHLNDFT